MSDKFELIITVGAPASGKSTWAESQTDYYNVSRDQTRKQLFKVPLNEYRRTNEKEKLVSDTLVNCVKGIIEHKTSDKKGIIIHDTHLKQEYRDYWKDFAEANNLEYKECHFNYPLDVLLRRNKHRGEKYVPESVIRSMYKRAMLYFGWKPVVMDTTLPKAVIFDIDGTLTTITNRKPYQWDKVNQDAINPLIFELFRMYQEQGYVCLVSSGRDGVCREMSLEHLNSNGLPLDNELLYMRKEGDSRKDSIVKEEFLREIAKSYNVVLCVDDRNSVVDMWRMHGITCLQVNYGDF